MGMMMATEHERVMNAADDTVGTPSFDGKGDREARSTHVDSFRDNETIAQQADLDSRGLDGYDAGGESAGAPTAVAEGLSDERAEQNSNAVEAGVFTTSEPWHEPINVAEVLDDVRQTILRFIVCNPETAIAATLWIAFTWVIDYLEVAPLAVITAPDKRCGKTQLLDLIGRLSRRPLFASNISAAAMFRVIATSNPTLLIDEGDTFVAGNRELRGIINSGHTRQTAFVVRAAGDHGVQFPTWSAKAIAAIGSLNPTIMDRAIVLRLRRKLPSERADRLRQAEAGLFKTLSQKLARFGEDCGPAIGQMRPDLPDALNDRAQDNWEPLLAIAVLAGGEWSEQARAAALAISGDSDDLSVNEELLAKIRAIFLADGGERIAMAQLHARLLADKENRGNRLTIRELGKRLKSYGISSKSVRISGSSVKGFERSQFDDAWERYLGRGGTDVG